MSGNNSRPGAYDNNGYTSHDEPGAPYRRSRSRDLEAANQNSPSSANQRAPSIASSPSPSYSSKPQGRAGVYTISTADTTSRHAEADNKDKKSSICIILVIIFVILLLAAAGLCLYLFVFKDSNSPAVTEKPLPESSYFEGVVVLKDEWTDDLSEKSSARYKEVEYDVLEEIDFILRDSHLSTTHTLAVTHMTKGSVNVMFTLELEDSMFTEHAVLKVLREGFTKRQDVSKLNIANPQEDIRLKAVEKKPTSPPTTSLTPTDEDTTAAPPTTTTTASGSTTTSLAWIVTDPVRTTPAPVQCEYLEHKMCRDKGGYIATGFPNIFRSQTQNEALSSLQRFLELEKKGCYEFTVEFACASLYPHCVERTLIHPCRSFCEEFAQACHYPVTCALFPDDDDPNVCTLSPKHDMHVTTTVRPDSNPCSGEFFRCGNNECVASARRCDGVDDCGDLSDEIKCGEQASSLDCDFERRDICRYTNDDAGHFDWFVTSGSTQTYGTGPTYDHTLRTAAGNYLLAESSGRYWLDVAMVKSSLVTMDTEHCLRFYFHMFGEEVESLKVLLRHKSSPQQQDEVIWRRSKQQGNQWRYGDVTLPAGTYSVLFQALRGRSHLGDVAVDDITARPGACKPRGCEAGEFMCNNGNCLQMEFRCNGKDECGDFSDEQGDCECSEEQWQCNMGLCIDEYKRCDGKYDCPDTSDERDCDCPLGQVRCWKDTTRGRCIPTEWLCDREPDCDGGEDEVGCAGCAKEQYQCLDFGCVDGQKLCDGVRDCEDGSDETDCAIQRPDSLIEVRHGKDFVPLCAADFPPALGDSLCQMLGKSHLLYMDRDMLQVRTYAKWSSAADVNKGLLQGIMTVSSSSCPSSEVLSLACAEVTCGRRSDDVAHAYVVGGMDAAPGRWPWQVGIILNGAFTCGGSIISSHHILTAAHCAGNGNVIYPASAFQITLGSIQRTAVDPRRQVRRVKKISIPNTYAYYFWGSDIAIMAMSEPVAWSDYVQPVCLPRPDEVFPPSSLCYVSGWGYTDYDNETVPEVLQEGKMKLWSASKCQSSYTFATKGMVCAGYNSGIISNCPGDSGGPLCCLDSHGIWKQVGVFSFMSIGCNVPMKPPVFTSVQANLTWIENNIECAFACDNGKCLVDNSDVCNGLDDCGDMSDETKLCVPSITCKFEERYMCGYTHAPGYKRWERRRSRVGHNYGPVTDWNNGTEEGYYMYSGTNHAITLAPLYHRSTAHCLKFHYHMRSSSVGAFKVFSVPVTSNATLSNQVNLAGRKPMFEEKMDLGDLWYLGMVNVEPGRFVLGFEGIAQNSPSPAIAIDDVELVEGNCDRHACGQGEFQCKQNGLCIDSAHLCNYHILCIDQSDELGCSALTPYTCDFENYGWCGLEQNHYTDRLDWNLKKTPSYGYFNGPLGDHTTNSRAGSYLLLSTLNGNAGERARISVPMHNTQQVGCLQLYLNMVSNGSITVTFYMSTYYELAWQKSRYSTNGEWQRVQISLPVGVQQVVLDGVVGSDTYMAASFIAIDDISISGEPCQLPTCHPNDYECHNGQCISRDHMCDGVLDCDDGTDELHSGPDKICECAADSFRCSDGQCLQGHVRCDGFPNCADKSDELTCQICGPNEYGCDDGTCKSMFTWCDGVEDCPDASDERADCQCMAEQFQCKNLHCILGSRYCDGVVDCYDGSDEPQGCMCDERWQFRCRNTGQCIPKNQRCDLINDCGDYSDEMNCECTEDEFACNNNICLDAWKYCNGAPDCPDGEDEAEDCLCAADQFRCSSGGCISDLFVCDAIVHCFDGSDEDQNCECYWDEFQCGTGQCLSMGYMCNGQNDCGDLSDEVNCTCSANQWKCQNGLCIRNSLICDGKDDCGDESDELGCGCRRGEFRCDDGSCIQDEWRCDGNNDCKAGEDEAGCSYCDKEIAFECGDYSCVSIFSRCDGIKQCPDGTDELGCVRLSSQNGETGLVEVYKKGQFYPLCYSPLVWSETWNNEICGMIGQGPALTVSSTELAWDSGYLQVVRPNGTIISSQLENTAACTSGEVIKLTCEHKECGQQPPPPTSTVSGPTAFIVGGTVAGEQRWPWMVAVYYLGVFRCGGVLVDRQWVMCAAHCFIWKNGNSLVNLPHYFEVELGAATRSSGSAAYKTKISHISMYENYTLGEEGFRYHDVALLHLVEPVELTDDHRSVCLPPVSVASATSSVTGHCFTAGWGFTNIDSQFAAKELREAKMVIWSGERCSSEQAWGDRVHSEQQICAGYESGHISTCYGDSGGPLMCQEWNGRWTLQGILSVGPSSCGKDNPTAPAKPSVYARVSSYMDWIKQEIGLYR